MTQNKTTYDWMLVTVRGYDKEKGYIYGNRHPDGKGVIVAKKHNVSRDWVKSLSNERDRTYTPPQSIIAVYGAEEKDEKSGFTIASWATPISKDLGQEDVYVTPIKVSPVPKQIRNQRSGKQTYVDAIVLDQRPIEVRSVQEMRDTALSMLDKRSKTALGLDGSRGFMIRIGHTAPDGSLGASSWEFFGRSDNTPEQTWNFYWNQKALPGRQKNLLQAVLTAAQTAFNDPNSYVEIVGCSRTLINDFGDPKRVADLAALPNYKTTDKQNNTIASYSLAAITVEKMVNNRIIKNQVPLPRNKIVNHPSGVLGNHVPGVRVPVAIKPILEDSNTASNQVNSIDKRELETIYPLTIKDHVNGDGEVKSFRVWGSKEALDKYQNQIESAVSSVKPFRVRGELAYSFPLRYKKNVESSLSTLTGSAPLYVQKITTQSGQYLTVSGETSSSQFRDHLDSLYKHVGAEIVNGQMLVPERSRASLVKGLTGILEASNVQGLSNSTTESVGNPAPVSVTQPHSKPNRTTTPKRVTFSDWQQTKFRKDPYSIMDSLDGYISEFAEQAGIDWSSARDAIDLGAPNQKGKLVKSSTVRPIDKSHRGSVAMAAHVYEKKGTGGNDDSIVWFKINFFNKKTIKDDVITFDAYSYLHAEYLRDSKNGVQPNTSQNELEAVKKKNEDRREKAKRDAETQAQRDQNSRNYWARKIPTMPPEDGKNQYFTNKGILHLLPLLGAHSGEDKNGRYSIISVHDMNFNFTGAQRIYENSWSDDKGKKTNKNFIQGTLFKDDATDLPYGTHKLIGNIDPSKPIIFCEGVADSGTDHSATGLPVAICLNKGNLYHVVGLYRQKYPNTRLIIASDNDFYNPSKGNVGFAAALDAARDHRAEYTLPSFSGLNIETQPTDYNDLEKLAGLDVVRSQFRNIRVPPEDILEFHKIKTQVIGLNKLSSHIDAATEEIISHGNHGVDKNRIRGQLVAQAVSAYGSDNVSKVIKDNLTQDIPDSISSNNTNENSKENIKYPVSLKEHVGASGKKSCLVVDSRGDNSLIIEEALKKIVGDRHLPYNSHLGGWVAPYPIMRLLNTYLHDLTGAPQLYIGQSRGKDSGTLFVVRGDFTDNDLLQKVSKTIQYAQPTYKKSQFGLVIPDSRAMPYIRESLKPYLTSNKDLELAIKQSEIPEPELNHGAIDEAMRLSGQSRGEIVLAHVALQFQDSGNIFLENDYAFSSVYSRVNKAFSHLEPDVRHTKALEEACTSIRAMLDAGIVSTSVSHETVQRLNELITHLEFTLNRAPIDSYKDLSDQERTALETSAEKLGADIDSLFPIILGEPGQKDIDRSEALSVYQNILSEIAQDLNNTDDEALEAPIEVEAPSGLITQDHVEPERKDSSQVDRIIKLLEITKLVVEKGFDEENLYDLFITQKGSPYHDLSRGTFNDVQYRQDLKYMSDDVVIPGWKPTSINSTSQLFYAIYGDVARERIGKLEDYMDAYFGANGVTHWKTFEKYFSGKQSFEGERENPYLMEGEVDYDVISKDLEYLTNYSSIHEFYRGVSDVFEQVNSDSPQDELFSGGEEYHLDSRSSVSKEVVVESSRDDVHGVVNAYDINGNAAYELVIQKDNAGHLETLHHDFNIFKDVALDKFQYIFDRHGLDDNLYPQGTKGAVSTSLIAEEKGNRNALQMREIDTGPHTFFQIHEIESQPGVDTIRNLGTYLTYQDAAEAFQNDFNSRKQLFTPLSGGSEPMASPEENDPRSNDVGERIKEWAKRGEPFEGMITLLKTELGVALQDSSLNNVRSQYDKLISKLGSDEELKQKDPDKRYTDLQEVTVRLAKSELTYDEYVDELFRTDGHLVEDNPYWNPKTNQVDRHGAFVDVRAAGYQSLAQFYENIFETIHHKSSTQLSLGRVGGYIPNEFDANQPLRPQFESIEKLFSSDDTQTPENLPPFNDWVSSLDAYNVMHPILKEDINTISSDELSDRYGKDTLLMLADVHGLSVDPNISEAGLAAQIKSQWNVRSQLASLTKPEISDLGEAEVTQALSDFGVSGGGSKREKDNRLVGHIQDLRAISKLRIAQYSYIYTALNLEAKGLTLPNYAHRAISQFINNECDFLDSANKAIELASASQLRNNVEIAIGLVNDITPIERTVLAELPDDKAKVIGVDTARKSALVFSDNYEENDKSASRYTNRYALRANPSNQEPTLPPHITHYAKHTSEVIATPVPIESSHLLQNDLRPVSIDAIYSVLGPLERWMDKYGYAGVIDTDGKTQIAFREGVKWNLRKIEDGENNLIGTFKSPKELLKAVSGNIAGFVDRDAAIEAWLQHSSSQHHSVVDNLKTINSDMATLDIDQISELITNEDRLNQYIEGHSGESVATKIKLIADGLINAINKESWLALVGHNELSSSTISLASEFVSACGQPSYAQEEEPVLASDPLYLLTPMEVGKLYDAYSGNDKSATESTLISESFDRHYASLPTNEKHLLATDIASGTYESIGHYLHEREVQNAIANNLPGAKEVADQFYPENEFDILAELPLETDNHGNNIVLATSKTSGEFFIGYAFDSEEMSLSLREISFANNSNSNTPSPDFTEGLLSSTGLYMPNLSLDEFRSLAEAYVAPEHYLNIDPRTTYGQGELIKLKKDELMDYASVLGASNKGSRVDIINRISDIAFAKEKISQGIVDFTNDLSADDTKKIRNAAGDFLKEINPAEYLKQWLIQNNEMVSAEITQRNYGKILDTAEQRLRLESIFPTTENNISLKRDEYNITLIENTNELGDISNVDNIKDVAGLLASDNDSASGYSIINKLGLNVDSFHSLINSIPPHIIVVPVNSNLNIQWKIKDTNAGNQAEYFDDLKSLQERVSQFSTSSSSGPRYTEGDMIAWIENETLNIGHVAADVVATESRNIPVTYSDETGRNYVRDLDIGESIKVPEDQFQSDYETILSTFEGQSKDLVLHFQDLYEQSKIDGDQSAAKALMFVNRAKGQAEEIEKHNNLLPDGYSIYQEGNAYTLKATGSENKLILNTGDTFVSPVEITRNIAVQQRSNLNEDSDYETSRNATSTTESMGFNREESLGVNAPNEIARASTDKRLGDNVVKFAREDHNGNGDDDEPPHDPAPGPGGGGISGADKLSSSDTSSSTGNSIGRSAPRTRGVSFQLSETLESDVAKGPEHRKRLNIEALEVRKDLLNSGVPASNEQKEILSRYTGWGGLSSVFSQYGYNRDKSDLIASLQSGEYERLKRSVLTAFYTPPTITQAIWEAVQHTGFSGGKVLDPSTGTGQFIGCSPESIANSSSFVGKEIEPVSASIAKLLYGNESIHLEPYEKAKLPNNYFDIAISNIPFGDVKVFDSEYKKHNFKIHDYFFSKSLDKVRPGGLVAFVTSTGTLDKKDPAVREHLYEKADLVGAIRLPRKTFTGYAGTDVNADIIILRKRQENENPQDNTWLWSIEREYQVPGREEDVSLPLNRYFLDNPSMVIGDVVAVSGRHGPELATSYSGSSTIADEVKLRIGNLPKNIYTENIETSIVKDAPLQKLEAKENLKAGNYVVSNGAVGIVTPEFNQVSSTYENTFMPVKLSDSDRAKISGMVALRDLAKDTINLQLGTYTQNQLLELQAGLNSSYDRFVNDHGNLNSTKNRRLFSADPDSPLLLALEKIGSNKDEYVKTDIFTEATIRKTTIPSKAESAEEALNISLGVKGSIDTAYISSITEEPWDSIADQLGPMIYLDPKTNSWQTKEQYLSGNIGEKLSYAKDAANLDSQYERNISALKEVMPTPISSYDIKVRLGATWIPVDDISSFSAHIVSGKNDLRNPQDKYGVSQFGGSWSVKPDAWELSTNEGRVYQEWGTKRLSAIDLIEKLLNNRQIVVRDKLDDGTSVVNRDETLAANQKADALNTEFREWIWSDPDRLSRLEKLYNDRYNVYVEPHYSGASVRLDGISPTLKGKPLEVRDSQKAAIQRYIFEGRTLNAHPVGAGKTLELVGSAMEGKRLGIHNKPLIVVPNNILSQFGRMALELYPGANTLVIDPKQLSKNARKEFTAKIATSDWDMVVIAQSSFDKIATPPDHQRSVIEQEKYKLEEALNELSGTDNRAAQLTVKRLERSLDKLEKKIEELVDGDKKDNFLYLNEIGVDALFVDEADNYLNLFTPTQMSHVPGVNTSSSQRAMNMLMAVRYIQDLNEGYRGVIFATGTDIRNSMSDMYTMLRYLGPDILEASQCESFDSFMGTFGEVVKTVEVNPEGTGYRENSRLSKFTNIPEMVMMYRQVADVLTDAQLKLPKPKVEEINIAADSGAWLRMYMAHLAERAKATRSGSVDNRDDNLLKIANDGRKASLDMRLVDLRIPDDPNSKVNQCIQNVIMEWEAGKDKKLAQIVFCDMGVPNKNKFSVYEDIKNKLVSSGIPEKEIAFSQDYKTDAKKKQLEGDINSGAIRVVVASTETLGVGSNIQERLVAQHNLDAPWRPRDLEQRGGRMERPGNNNDLTRRYNYTQSDSFDLFMWETLKRKAAFIQQAKVDPRSAAREIDEDLNPTYSEVMAITTGNPLIRQKIEVDSTVEKLQSAERSHKRAQWDNSNQISNHQSRIDSLNEYIGKTEGLIAGIKTNNSEVIIDGHRYTDQSELSKKISKVLKHHNENNIYKGENHIHLGTIGTVPFFLSLKSMDGQWAMRVGDKDSSRVVSDLKSVKAKVESLITYDKSLSLDIKRAEREISRHSSAIESLVDVASKPFSKKEELLHALDMQKQINTDLSESANDEINKNHQTLEKFTDAIESTPLRASRMRVG